MLANHSVAALAVGLVVAVGLAYGLARWRYARQWAKLDQLDGQDRRYYRDVAAVGMLLALVAGFFWRPLFNSGYSMPNGGGDLVSFYYPIHVFASQSLRSGELPFWNPSLFSGMPFSADIQSGLLYPVNWLFWWLGYPVTYEKVEMLVLVHYWLAGAFSYALARSLGLGRWPSLLAGTVYAFSGFAVAHLGHLPMFATTTWLPLVLLAVNQAARPQPRSLYNWRWAVAAGLLLGVCFVTGNFQLFLYDFYLALAFWLAVAWRGRKVAAPLPSTRRLPAFLQIYWAGQAGRGLLTLVVMGLAALAQLWPFYEVGQLSIRADVSYEKSLQFGGWPTGLIELILPNLFTPNPQAYFGYWSNTDVLGYAGLFTFGLAGLGVLLRPVGRSQFYPLFFLSLAVAGVIFSLSGYTIFQGWFYQFVPALNLTRAAGRFMIWFDLGIGLGAAYGLQNWLDYQSRPVNPENERTLRWSWRALALAALAILLVPLPLLYAQIISTPGNINDLAVRGTDGLGLAVIFLGLGAVLLRLYYRRSLGPDAGAFLAIVLVVFDLFSVRSGFNVQSGNVANGFFHDQTAQFLRQQDPTGQYRIEDNLGSVGQVWQPDTAQLYRLYDVRGLINPLQLASYETLWNAITSAQKDFRTVPAYNLFGARYILSRNKEEPNGPQYKVIYKDDRPGVKLNVTENSAALPRAWLLHQTQLKPSSDTLPALLTPDFKPAELAYLQSGRALNGPAGSQSGEEVRLTAQSTNRLDLSVNAASEGYVFINQNYYPGWTAQLDGQNVPIEKADYTFQAVYVSPGQHRLNLSFIPTYFWPLLLIYLTTWLAGLLFLVWPLLARLKRR